MDMKSFGCYCILSRLLVRFKVNVSPFKIALLACSFMQALTFDPKRRHNLMHSGDNIVYDVWFMAEHSKNIFLWLLFKNVTVVKYGFLHAFYS